MASLIAVDDAFKKYERWVSLLEDLKKNDLEIKRDDNIINPDNSEFIIYRHGSAVKTFNIMVALCVIEHWVGGFTSAASFYDK